MLTALIVCSDDRADTLASTIEGFFVVYAAELDTEFLKNYEDDAPHGEWRYKRWERAKWHDEANPPRNFDLLFVHTGANDLAGSGLASARISFAFSANGVSGLSASYNLIPVRCEFPYSGESPVSAEDAQALSALLSSSGQIDKDEIIRNFRFCSVAASDITSDSASIAAELLELEKQRVHLPLANEEELLEAAIASARQEPDPLHLYSNEQLRPKLWHVCKNVLFAFQSKQIGKSVVDFTITRMERWEIRAWGERTADLKNVADLLRRNDREAAADLADDTYRRYASSVSRARMQASQSAPVNASDINESRSRRFSILVVDDDEEFLRNSISKLRALGRACRDYEVEILMAGGVNAFSDAITTVDQHTGIQGLIVDWDLTSRAAGQRLGTGIDLIKRIHQVLPRVHACLLTGRGALSIAAEIGDEDIRPFSKADADSLDQAFAFIVSSIRDRQATPFFSALAEYSGRQVSPFHALAISGGRGIRKSPWLDSFYDFYGARVFSAETSSTQPPLDSLLSPKGSIRDAEARAAQVFGADRVRFVTNGTSTANKIVHQALLRPGDTVLIDRTCHKSHHYALMLVGAMPVYLEADPVSFESDFLGFCTGVRTAAILDALRAHPHAKMLCLTNCTFDGYVHDIRQILKSVIDLLNALRAEGINATAPEDFIFFFDEAWFGTALFTRALRAYSAMEAARSIPSARVYATQSTHKTLVAFRQGSMILVRDPRFFCTEEYFNESFYTHTTTSPNYSIIASLDAGRMWADLDGDRICNEAWKIAIEIRRQIGRDPSISREFVALGPDDLVISNASDGMSIDQTKITLYIRDKGLTGRAVNTMLADEDIQFNKYTNNTVLLIVTPGTNESSAAHLVVSLRRLAAKISTQRYQAKGLRADLPPEAFKSAILFRDDLDLRSAYFGQGPAGLIKLEIKLLELEHMLKKDLLPTDCVSSRFVIPYPPGFPLLVPGQCVNAATVRYLLDLETKEIHGMPVRDTLGVWIGSDLLSQQLEVK